METELTAKFELIDDMSSKIADVAQSGENLADALEDIGEKAGDSFDTLADSTVSIASSVDGVATSFAQAADQTDYWTDKLGSYDKSAMEALYTLDELVEMGYKTADAYGDLDEEFDLCDRMASMLNQSMEGSVEIQEELAKAVSDSSETMSELANNERVSAEVKEDFMRAAENAAEAMNELNEAQKNAEQAMAAYDEVMISGTTDINELENAAQNACWAAEALQDANEKASEATAELSKSTADANEAIENSASGFDKMTTAVGGLAGALAGAGIIAMVKQITDSVYELAEAFSEAESVVVKATGATGAALEDLEASMMASYANTYNSLDSVAGAVGEINTRMGLTGDELTATTDLFLEFSNVTGVNVVSAVQDATKVMNKYGLETSDLAGLLDQLTYAGQISGASVSSLSSTLVTNAAVFQNAGLSVENAIAMLADFELAGINSSTAVMGLRTAVNNLASDGEDAQTGLERVVREIAEMENQSDATALAVETFGSRAGQELALAIRNGTISVETFSNTLEGASGTMDITADASETLAQKWQESNNKISAAFTTAVQPAMDKFSSSMAELMGEFGDFLNENPEITKALTAIATGIGVTVVAVAGASAAFGVATAAAALFGTTLSAAIWPLTAAATAIAAVTGAVLILKGNYDNAYDSAVSMTASTKAQAAELEELQTEYARACDELDETDPRVLSLKYQIDDLTDALASNGQTMAEFYTEVDNAIAKNTQLFDSYDNTSASIHDQEINSLALIQKLQDLAAVSTEAGGAEEAMKKIIDELNGSVSGLDLTYDDFIADQDSAAEAARKLAQAQAEQDLKTAQWDEYVGLIGQAEENETELAKVESELAAAQEDAAIANQRYTDVLLSGDIIGGLFGSERAEMNAANDRVDELTKLYEEYNDTIEESARRQTELEEALGLTADQTENLIDETTTWEDVAEYAYSGIKDEVEKLCQAYDDAYESALASFEGQFSLFDTAEADMGATVEAAQAALDSQVEYWTQYGENIERLKALSAEDLGITQESYENLMAYVQDGSQQAAGLAASMVSALDQENVDAITNLANTMDEVSGLQEQVATSTADWQTDFTEQMEQYAGDMAEIITDDLELSEEAATSAQSTMESYAQSILTNGESAVQAAQQISTQVAEALNASASAGVISLTPGEATGTVNAPSAFIAGEEGRELVVPAHAAGSLEGEQYYMAGENGPELIVGMQGSEVFPKSETDRIINSLNGNATGAKGTNRGDIRHIILEIAGSGSIDIGAGTDVNQVIELIQDNLKPVLLNILQEEILEEGDLSYEY